MKSAFTLCLVWLMLLSSTSFGAIVNGGFEDAPAFSSWDRLGLTSLQTDAFGITPPGPPNQALLRTGDGQGANTGVDISDLAAFLSVTEAEIVAIAPGADQNGSAIRQAVTGISAGDTLTFDWNFVTAEGALNPQDTAFFTVSRVNGTSETFFLADPSDATTPFVTTEFARQTTYNFLSTPYEFTVAGDYVLGFGVLNLEDRFGPSGLLIDNVLLTAVPEPTALAGLGLLGLTLTLRRRRRRRQ